MTCTVARLDMLAIKQLRDCNPTLDGRVSIASSLLEWLRCALRHERLSEDSFGFYLTVAQRIYWDEKRG